MKKIFAISILALLLSSCFQEPGVNIDNSVFLVDVNSENQNNGQIFFNLDSRAVVSQNSVYEWDLAFDCRDGKFSIVLNSGKGMGAFNTYNKNFERKYEIMQYPWRFDHPCGDLSQTCIGQWGDFTFQNPQSYSDVYLLNLGLRGRKTPIGFRKMQIIEFVDSSYVFRYSDLNNKNVVYDTLKKNANYNFVYYSFKDGGKQVMIEPPKTEWDVVLGPYTEFRDEMGPFDIPINKDYAIYGGLMHNRHQHKVAIDSVNDLNEINYFGMSEYEWHENTNTIGKSWRRWSENDSSYHVFKDRTYLVKNQDRYYLIKFKSYNKEEEEISQYRFEVKSL